LILRPLDQEERILILEDLEQTYLVEAGAGTGKTTLLVGRILNLLITKKAELKNLAAITFTEKAATELKQRLNAEISARLTDILLTKEQHLTLKRALEQLPKASVGTIHSFAASMLREISVEFGIDPFFSVQDSLSGYLFLKNTWETWIVNAAAQEAETLEYLLRCKVSISMLQALAKDMLRLGEVTLPETSNLTFSFTDFYARIREVYEIAKKGCTNNEDKGYVYLQTLLGEVKPVGAIKETLTQHMAVVRLKKIKVKVGAKKNYTGDSLHEMRELIIVISEELEQFKDDFQNAVASKAAGFLKPFCDYFSEEKKKLGVLDFDDLLINSAQLLRENIPARAYFKTRYKYIFIDEFQDVDPLQVEIAFFLSETECEKTNASIWQDVRLIPGKLFIVGDPKQSIYRFRKADMEMYFDVCEKIRREGRVVAIRQNFRSKDSIITWTNTFFESVMESGSYQAQYIPIIPKEQDGTPNVIHLLPDKQERERLFGEKVPEKRKVEARGIARFLESVFFPEKSSNFNANIAKALRPQDCAILFRSLSNADIYLEALRELGIPCHIIGGKTYFKTSEISYFISLLTVIDYPFDAINLMASLKSPFFSISDEEIFLFKEEVGALDFMSQDIPASSSDFSGVISAFKVMRLLYEKKQNLALPQFIETVLEETSIFFTLTCKPGGGQKVANLKKIVEYAWGFEEMNAGVQNITLKQFIVWLREMIEGNIEAEEPVLEENDDAVSFLSIHKSKGLEYPMVILADMFHPKRTPHNTVLVAKENRALQVNIAGNKTHGWYEAEEEDNAKDEAEEARIFYVAATRAKNSLVLPMYVSKGAKKYFEWFKKLYPKDGNGAPFPYSGDEVYPILSGTTVIEVPEQKDVRAVEKFSLGKADFWNESEKDLYEQEREAWLQTRAADVASHTYITPSSLHDYNPELYADSYQSGGGGKDFGTLVHAILEKLDFKNIDNLPELCKIEAQKHDMEKHTDSLIMLVKKNTNTMLFEEMKEADKLIKELSFAGMTSEGEIIIGQADVLFLYDGEWTLGDYKTDKITDAAAAATQYIPQIHAYISGLSKTFPYKISRAFVHFLEPAESVEVPLSF